MWAALLGLLAWPAATADSDRPLVTVQLEEQSACRLLAGGYTVSFSLRTSYRTSGSEPVALYVAEQRVTQALVTWEDADPITFALPMAAPLDEVARISDRIAIVGPGQSVESIVTAHVPLSTDPSAWPTTVLPGDYRVRFTILVPAVAPSGTTVPVETLTPSFSIRIPDPTSVQECPFDMAPRDLLVAPPR